MKGSRLTRFNFTEGWSLEEKTVTSHLVGILFDLENLWTAIYQAAICSLCKDPRSKLSLVESVGERKGLAQTVTLNCSVCPNVTEFCSSKRSEQRGSSPFDINTRSVHASLSGV